MNEQPEVTYLQAIQQAVQEESANDPTVFVIRHHDAVRRDEPAFAAGQVVAVPQSAATSIGVAIGAALQGLRPVVELHDSLQLTEALDHLEQMAARLHWQSGGGMQVPLVVRVPIVTRSRTTAWHAHSPEARLTHIPGLKVVAPSTPYDAKGLLKAAIRDNNPVIFLEQKYLYHRLREDLPTEDYVVPIGQAEVRRLGVHLTILSYGALVYHAVEAAEVLARDSGIVAEVVDLRTLAPLDFATIRRSLAFTNRALIVHEDTRSGGPGAELAAVLSEHFFASLAGPIMRVTAPDLPYPQIPELEAAYLPDTADIIAAARKLAAY